MPRTNVPSKDPPSLDPCSKHTPKSQASSSILPVKQKQTLTDTRSKKIKVSNDRELQEHCKKSGVYSSIYKSTSSFSLQAPTTKTQTPSSAVHRAVELTTHTNAEKQQQQQRTLKTKNKHKSNHKNSFEEGSSQQSDKKRVVLTKNKRRHSMLKIYGMSIRMRFRIIIYENRFSIASINGFHLII